MAGFLVIIGIIILWIWSDLGFTFGGLVFAIVFVVLGLMGIFKLDDIVNKKNKKKTSEASPSKKNIEEAQHNPNEPDMTISEEAVGTCAATSSGTGIRGESTIYSDNYDDEDDSYDNNDDDWDNSREAGGMPRDLSPFSDIDDPYDRAELEWDMFDERDGGDFWD